MKLSRVAALVLFAASAAPAFASSFVVDFEHDWTYDSLVNSYYSGGTANDGSAGANLGVEFVNVAGLSNDPNFPSYYSGAPSPQGTAYVYTFGPEDRAYMNVAAGVAGGLSFYYSSPEDRIGAVKAYSGLNGTGTLLGSFDLAANSSSYDTWNDVTFKFGGLARSFDLTSAANMVGFDNISAVPEPGMLAMLLAGGIGLAARARRRA